MRVLLLLACALASGMAAPQAAGYTYQSQNNALEDYQLQQQLQLQQLLQQEEYLKQELQKELQKQQREQEQQKPATDAGGYQFANQLVQQAQQLVQYEQHEQQQQQQSTKSDSKIEEVQIPVVLPESDHFVPIIPQAVNQYTQPPTETQLAVPETVSPNYPVVAPQTQYIHTPTQTEQFVESPESQYIPPPQQQQQYEKITSNHQQHHAPTPTTQSSVKYNKEFFYLSAPQDDYDTPQNLQNELQQIKKNLRVVFIKAPEHNGISEAALALAKQNANSQTAIYVLTKQHDANDLANKLQQIRAENTHKPEVIFVKYRTPQEAEQAQRTIQAQYDALDGPSHFNHEGSVASHSFIGSVGKNNGGDFSADATPASKYLPTSLGAVAKHK